MVARVAAGTRLRVVAGDSGGRIDETWGGVGRLGNGVAWCVCAGVGSEELGVLLA